MERGHIIMVPGLGLSTEVFKYYDFPGFNVHKLEWIEPVDNESLSSYANRMIDDLDLGRGVIYAVGHSLGGVLVQELARHIKIEKTFLISSIKSETEIPFKLTVLRSFNIYKLIKRQIIYRSFPIWATSFGYNTKELRTMFLNSIKYQSNTYLSWAIYSLITWKKELMNTTKVFHFHGSKDKTFPISLIKEPILIPGGDHQMVVKETTRLNAAILQIINSPSERR